MSTLLIFWTSTAVLYGGAVHGEQSAHEALVNLAQDITYSSARSHPMLATALGIPGYDSELEIPAEALRAADLERLDQWKSQLGSIIAQFDSGTALVDRDDAMLLQANLDASINELRVYQFDRKDYSAYANNVAAAIFTQFQQLPSPGEDGATPADLQRAWSDITSRLAKTPAYIVAAHRLVIMPGHLFGIIGGKQLAGAQDFFRTVLTEAARTQLGAHSRAYGSFLKARDAALTAIAESQRYIDEHSAAWPENYAMGRQAYDRMLQEEQLLPFDAPNVMRIGYDDLAHGWAEEAWLQDLSRRSGVALGAPSGGGLAPGGAALIDYYRDRIGELHKFVTDQDVVTIPGWLGAMRIVETPAFLLPVTPGAAMNPSRLFSTGTTGYYYITPPKSLVEAAERLDMNQDFDRDRILLTAAHEAIPGHFMQLSIAKRHPDFVRRIQDSAVFSEGWAFYCEEMFVRLGLFGTDLDGRLATARWERVRGARAVVDVRLASGEWTYEKAVKFFASETGFTDDQSEASVASIALEPGYFISYTVGRIQIESLLAEYLRGTAGRGTLHDFHDRLLSYGTVPLAVVGPELLADLKKPASAVRAAADY